MKVPENRENSKMSWKNTGCLFESLHSVAPAIGSGSYIVISKTYQKHTPWYNIHGVLITSSFRRVWQLYYINITTVLKTNTNHTTYCWYCGWKKILHQLIPVSSLSHHLRCCIHPKWCRISSSNRSKCSMYTLSSASSMNSFLEMWLLKRGQWLLDKNICRLVSVEVIGREKYIENTKIPYMFFFKKKQVWLTIHKLHTSSEKYIILRFFQIWCFNSDLDLKNLMLRAEDPHPNDWSETFPLPIDEVHHLLDIHSPYLNRKEILRFS